MYSADKNENVEQGVCHAKSIVFLENVWLSIHTAISVHFYIKNKNVI
jgi:hypothetical protein